MNTQEMITEVIRAVAELPDRDSPEDRPEIMLVSDTELRNILEEQLAESSESLQPRVQPWLMACFGPAISADREERNHRFLEEALELVQACGATRSEALQLVDYVYGREVGEKVQEVGGVMITLAALCLAQGIDMHEAGETELARIWTLVDQIRAKQAAKPKHSPLPEAPAPAETEGAMESVADRAMDLAMKYSDEVQVGRVRIAELCSQVGIVRDGLRFYADGDHFIRHSPDAWDTVSGEPMNFYEDEANTATVEDGSVAKMALARLDSDAHPDDIAVDRFAAFMKAKMAASRAKGRGGWNDPAQCSVETLQTMMLHARGAPVSAGWISASAPNTPENSEVDFIIACKRSNGKTAVFPATYLNAKLLQTASDDCPEDGVPFTGWYLERTDESGDWDSAWWPVCESGDEVTHYMPLPAAPAGAGGID
jgi:hypothetical protein